MLVFFALGYLIWAIALFNSASLHFDERTEFSNENPPNYSGIFANAPGYESSNETRLIMVHGIGKHCIGYSDELVRGVLAERGVTKVPRYDDWLDGGLALAHDEYIEMRDSMSAHFEYQPPKISKSRGRIHWPKAKGLIPPQRRLNPVRMDDWLSHFSEFPSGPISVLHSTPKRFAMAAPIDLPDFDSSHCGAFPEDR